MTDPQDEAVFKGKHILVVDDAETSRTYLRNVLASRGAFVDGAATGQEGLAMCAQQPYDLILLDLLLPDVDGVEVLKTIRATNITSTVVMVTGYGGIRSAIAAMQLGADGYIEKQDITSTVRDHVEFLYALEQAMDHRAGVVAQEQLNEVRADFYSMVTHDLRGPSAVILISAEMLTGEEVESLTPSQRDLISIIDMAAQKLFALINDYLDFAQIEAGYLRLNREKVDLCEVVVPSIQFAQVQAHAKRQTFTVDIPSTPVMAWCDAAKLQQVLDNLLSNAVKYTPPTGQITLQVCVEGEQAVFRVSDTGGGIPSSLLASLFTKYHRVPDESTRGIQGSGLGLLIAKEIVEAHGGSIRAESEGVPGKGSTFVFHIPLSEIAGNAAQISNHASDTSPPVLEAAEPSGMQGAELYRAFLEESRQHIGDLRDVLHRLYHVPGDRQMIEAAQRITHTLKGNAGAMQATTVRDLAAQMDEVLRQAKKGKTALTPEQVTSLAQMLDQIESGLEVQ
jgi:signal transduction histidine kinase/HPt (histidine-containing phosphotransfer) domain-containing protein